MKTVILLSLLFCIVSCNPPTTTDLQGDSDTMIGCMGYSKMCYDDWQDWSVVGRCHFTATYGHKSASCRLEFYDYEPMALLHVRQGDKKIQPAYEIDGDVLLFTAAIDTAKEYTVCVRVRR